MTEVSTHTGYERSPKYVIAEFLRMVKISRDFYILVEGEYDKRAIDRLAFHLYGKCSADLSIAIWLSEQLEVDTRSSRKELIIQACNEAAIMCQGRVAGLVDRDTHGFDVSEVTDNSPYHEEETEKGILWTRGHSLENYFFTDNIIGNVLTEFTTSGNHNILSRAFKDNMKQIFVIASAIYLFGVYLNEEYSIEYRKVKAIIENDVFIKEASGEKNALKLNTSRLVEKLLERYIELIPNRTELEHKLANILEKVSNKEVSVLRWFCHGHIALRTLLFAYKVLAGSNFNNQNEKQITYSCIEKWGEAARTQGLEEYPAVLFEFAGLDLS